MMKRALNFNAGPAALPLPVLEEAQRNWLDFNGTGMSVMELSHRSREYEDVHEGAKTLLRRILGVPDDYEVLFLQGGASLQFSMLPMNLLAEGKTGYYALTGSWAEKAMKEAAKIGKTAAAASSKEDTYRYIPELSALNELKDAAYLHLTSNNTIYGTQWQDFPEADVPLAADMSSDIMSREIDVSKFDIIYAGAQKNLGPSGVTAVIMKKSLLSGPRGDLPVMLDYFTHSKSQSLYNTPPTLAIYMLKLVLEWVEKEGGLAAIAERNKQKAELIYSSIDDSEGFYQGHSRKDSRSHMNITFNLHSEGAAGQFLQAASEAGFVGLNGHRSIGGCRASIYNAVPLEHAEQLARFMRNFKNKC
jgi:phosphoserine aminotransferase